MNFFKRLKLNRFGSFFISLSLLIFILSFSSPEIAQARRERYKSYNKSERSYERYDSKDSSDRRHFDRNFERYQSLSPKEKRKKRKKWRNFKEKTTPEERAYIMRKLRKKQKRHRSD